MAKTYINPTDCPFREGDYVKCDHCGVEALVLYVEDEHVFCLSADGHRFYRTWAHNLDTVFKKSGGGLTRTHRPEPEAPDGTEPNSAVLPRPGTGEVAGDVGAAL